MLPVFRFDLFGGALSILLCVFGVSSGVSLAMNFGELLCHYGIFLLVFSTNCWEIMLFLFLWLLLLELFLPIFP